jgi:hypothetical protein
LRVESRYEDNSAGGGDESGQAWASISPIAVMCGVDQEVHATAGQEAWRYKFLQVLVMAIDNSIDSIPIGEMSRIRSAG